MWPQKCVANRSPSHPHCCRVRVRVRVCVRVCVCLLSMPAQLWSHQQGNQLCSGFSRLTGHVWGTNRTHRAESQTALVSEGSKGPSSRPACLAGREWGASVCRSWGKVTLQSQEFPKGMGTHWDTLSPSLSTRALQGGEGSRRASREESRESEQAAPGWAQCPGEGLPQEGRQRTLPLPTPSLAPAPAGSPPHFH